MGLMDTIRKAEERSREAARRGLEKARTGWEDTERAMRRRMRVYPHSDKMPSAQQPPQRERLHTQEIVSQNPERQSAPPSIGDEAARRDQEAANRKAIVSINGKDIGEDKDRGEGELRP